MSFKSLVNKLVKEGKSREAATKIAGKVANAKMKGAGSGPTAKQKARMKGSPAKNTGGGRKKVAIDNKETATMKRKSFRRADGSAKLKQKQTSGELGSYEDGMVRKTRKIEKRNPEKKGRRINKTVKVKTKDGVEVRKTKYREDANKSTTERTSYYRPKGSLKKKAKQRTTTTNVKDKSTPIKMKKQGYNARLDDSLGAKHGKKSQSLKSRRDESEGMEKSMGKRKFSGNKSSAQGSPAKRFQAYDQMDTRNAAQTAGSPMGMYGKHSPANMSGQSYDAKEAYNKNLSASARLHYLENNRADAKAKKGGHSIHKHMGGRR